MTARLFFFGRQFPYFFVGTFIEADKRDSVPYVRLVFPYFFVGTFIEADSVGRPFALIHNFPTFS